MKMNGKKGSRLVLRLASVLLIAVLLCGMGLPAAAEGEPVATDPVNTESVNTEQPTIETPAVSGGEGEAELETQESPAPTEELPVDPENTPALSEVPEGGLTEIIMETLPLVDVLADPNAGITPYATQEGAQVYFLRTPTGDAESNNTGYWSEVVQYNGNNATVEIPNNLQWVDKDKNIFATAYPLSEYIVAWPDGSTGATWTLNKADFAKEYQEVYKTYKEQLEKELSISNLQPEDIQQITLIPFKISKNNGTNPPKHIDCTISVKCSKAYVAQFNVQMPGNVDYTMVSAVNKKITNDGPDAIGEYTDSVKVPETILYNGITYRFDGWYNEADGKVGEWPYTPNTTELADGTVNFYARYVPATTSVIVTKQVTGNMGDVNKDFSFTYSFNNIDGTQNSGNFMLKNGGSATIKNIPIGATLTLTEANADGYVTTATYGSVSIDANNGAMSFMISGADNNNIVVTNRKDVTIDTGVSLDALPYVLLLGGMAVLGGTLLLRRREDRA